MFAGYCIGGPYHAMQLAHYTDVYRVPMRRDLATADERLVEGRYEWAEDKWVWSPPSVPGRKHQ